MMADRGIIMSAPMVRALLDGTKTQTRRLAWAPYKPVRKSDDLIAECHNVILDTKSGEALIRRPTVWQKAQPGDRLWVRETWNLFAISQDGENSWPMKKIPHKDPRPDAVRFAQVVDFPVGGLPGYDGGKGPWRPSIHMPRWASRLTLEVTDVRRQRLHEISEEDALAEGIHRQDPSPEEISAGICTKDDFVFIAPGTRKGFGPRRDDPQWGPTAVFAYRCLWNCLHGNGAWDENPEVAALTFTIHPANIDQLGEEAA